MRVDISQILSQKDVSMPFALSASVENIEGYPDVVDFLAPVLIKGDITNTGKELEVKGVIKTQVAMKCSRCLAPVEVNVHVGLDEKFKATGNTDKEETETFSGNIIDLTGVIEKNILFSLPMKALCKDECKGLCPVCGKNLNEEACDCDTTEIDPRFEGLRSLFKLDEEV